MLKKLQKDLEQNLRRQNEIDLEIQDLQLERPHRNKDQQQHVSVMKKSLSVFWAPYFKDNRLFTHPKNRDTLEKQKKKELDVYISYPTSWSKDDRHKLKANVREDSLKKKLKHLIEEKEVLTHQIKAIGASDQVKEEIHNKLKGLEKKINEISAIPDDKLFVDRNQDFDWMKISAQVSLR